MQKIILEQIMVSTPRELGYMLVHKPLVVLLSQAAPETLHDANSSLWRAVVDMATPVRQAALDDTWLPSYGARNES